MDKTEGVRRVMVGEINAQVESGDAVTERQRLEAKHGQVWDTEQLTQDFDVKGFMAPAVVVKCKATGEIGTLFFQDMPRFYFGWYPDKNKGE